MARNGSGSHSVPNTFTAGATITSAGHNQNWADVSAEITNSVAADGQTSMTGPLKAANGSASAPSQTFASDTDTGSYRIGANNYGIAVGGTKIVDVASTGVTVTGDVDATVVKQGGFRLLPAGLGPLPYSGATAPDGWLFCYGQAVSRTTYADLFAAIGTTYGSGDGSTTFNLPDGRGRVVAGKDDMGGTSANRLTNQSGGLNGDTLGATGGAETHTLTLAESAAHDHGGTTGTTAPDIKVNNVPQSSAVFESGGSVAAGISLGQQTASNTSHSHTITSAGGGGAHNNVQPTIIANFIIKY